MFPNERVKSLMTKHLGIVLSLFILSSCAGTVDPVTRGAEGVTGGAVMGCAVGAAMTIWTGPIAAVGCGLGAMAGAGMGGMLGVATAPQIGF